MEAGYGHTYTLINGSSATYNGYSVDGSSSDGGVCYVQNARNVMQAIAALEARATSLEALVSSILATLGNPSLCPAGKYWNTVTSSCKFPPSCDSTTIFDSLTNSCKGSFVDLAPDPMVMAQFWGYGFGLILMMFALAYVVGHIIKMFGLVK